MISSATGVRKEFYFKFAQFVLQREIDTDSSSASSSSIVICYDYRGIGNSFPPENTNKDASLVSARISEEWSNRDFVGVLAFSRKIRPANEVLLVGHSVGIHILAFLDEQITGCIKRILSVSAQNAFLGMNKDSLTWMGSVRTWTTIGYLFPLLTRMAGKFPAKSFNMFEDLPKDVALEWFNYCRHEVRSFRFEGRNGTGKEKERLILICLLWFPSALLRR